MAFWLSRKSSQVQSKIAIVPNYLDVQAERLGISELAPSEIHEKLGHIDDLCHGPTRSKLGGRVVKDLQQLSPQEFSERARESEDFLKQKVVTYPADESSE